jgi:mercuric ion binding protein
MNGYGRKGTGFCDVFKSGDMRNLWVVGVFGLLLWTLSPTFAADNTKEAKIKTSAICNMCKLRIERNVVLSKGVKEAVLDVKSKILTVQFYPGKTNVKEIRETVSKIGYDADEVVAVQKAHDKLPKCCRKDAAPHVD